MDKKKAVVLLSGGIDSATTAALAISRGFELSALVFRYGQRHGVEVRSAEKLVRFFGISDHAVIDIPAGLFRSALTDRSIAVPKNRDSAETDIPATYVPARNILFLTYGLAYAESIGARSIFIGATAVDYSGYPDCRPEFFAAYQEMANRGTKAGIEGDPFIIETPLITMSKSEIIRTGARLGVDFALTHSCYDPDRSGRACGACDSCRIRKRGFAEAGVADPTIYRAG